MIDKRTALSQGLVSCADCHLICEYPAPHTGQQLACPRCGAKLLPRKQDSLSRCWAYLIATLILYIPANIIPIMSVTQFGQTQSDTILTGVIYLAKNGQWPLAGLIFFASIIVPLFKLLLLVILLVTVQRKSAWRMIERTRMYRLTELIGRWSMVDIYVVTILVGLVKFGSLASIEAEAGAIFFGAVVVLTILSANAFDPRLIWDKANE